MFLKMVKELDEEDARILKNAKENENILRKLTNIDFLCRDVFNENGEIINKKFQNKSIIVNLGKSVQAEFGIVNNFYGEAYGRVQPSNEVQEELVFSCGINKRVQGINFSVINKETGNIKFQSVVFHPSTYDKNSMIYNQLIILLGSYFYDKKALYTKIRNLLDFNRKNFANICGEDFISNLILLFSAKYEDNKIKDFSIIPSKTKDHFLKTEIIRKNWLYLGCERFYPKKYTNTFWFQAELSTKLWLKGKELILITSYSNNNHEGDRSLETKVNNPEFIDFTNEQLNDWLKHIVGGESFGRAIYETLKTKFLLSNI